MTTPEREPLRLGLSACFFHADPKRPIFKGKTLQYLEQSIAHWVMSEGNKAYLIPALPERGALPLATLVEDFDGLVLQGGSDVAPGTYGETPLRPEWGGDAIRDRYEIELVREFLRQKKPVLGICRGAQLLNVAFGGTLWQDIETQVAGSLNHRNWDIYDQNFHDVRIEEGSGLARLYGAGMKRINTIHHQGIKELGEGLVAEAVSPTDGLIEAIRSKGDVYALAVQWHPEFHDPNDPSLLDGKLFLREYMAACFLARAKRTK
jgi:putative glutamine amidotransferase